MVWFSVLVYPSSLVMVSLRQSVLDGKPTAVRNKDGFDESLLAPLPTIGAGHFLAFPHHLTYNSDSQFAH